MRSLLNRLRALPDHYLIFFVLLLCFPAYLTNLGLAAFIGDEAIRAWVALEMDYSGNYIATTMHGEPYLNKPALFNWMILAVARLWGAFDEIPSRLITVISLALFGLTVYRVVRRHFSAEFAFLAAAMTVTSGRILFYDSMLGLIDTTFSWVMYALFMSIYFFGKRERWLSLFIVSYLLMVVGCLLKGFPAIVFQGLSLLAGLYFFGKLKLLFSWKHVAGALPALGMLGLYLAVYAQYRPLEALIPNLLHESVKRTAAENGFIHTLFQVVKFPFDSIYHFLPHSLLIVFWLDKTLWQRIRSNEFVYFNFVMLAVNLPVYWTSAGVMPRYLLMFIPLFNTIGLNLLEANRSAQSRRFRFYFYVTGALLVAGFAAAAVLPIIPEVNSLPGIWPLSISLVLIMALLATMHFWDKRRFLWWFVVALLVVRVGFDLIVLPVRHRENDITVARRDAIRLADKYRDRHWYVYADSETREPAMFYATERLGYIIRRTGRTDISNALYLVNMRQYPDFDGRCLDTLRTDYTTTTLLLFVRD